MRNLVIVLSLSLSLSLSLLGYGRHTTGDYIQFLGIARGSANEVITQLILAQRVKATSANIQPLIDQYIEISRMLSGMMRSLSQKK